jgi:DinB family
VLQGMDDQTAMSLWTLVRGDKHLFAAPKITVARSILLNHWYHHRGQLSVYLRLLDVPLPSVYGPSADENPFAIEG